MHGHEPRPTGKRRPPRAKGGRLGACAEITATADWREFTVNCSGQLVTLRRLRRTACDYSSFKHAPGCLVPTRDPGWSKPCDWASSASTQPPSQPG